MKRALALVAGAALAGTLPSTATLLVYDGFNYTTGTASGSGVLLNGQGGGIGWAAGSNWTTVNTGTANSVTVYQQGNLSGVNISSGAANVFDGTLASSHSTGTSNFVTSGGYFGPVGLGGTSVTTDHTYAYRTIAPSVTATFVAGTSTWFSYVTSVGFSANPTNPKMAIGADRLNTIDRGFTALGEAIGAGGGIGGVSSYNNSRIYPEFWDQVVSGTGSFSNFDAGGIQTSTASSSAVHSVTDSFARVSTYPDLTVGVPNIVVFRIDWSNSGPDVISVASFLQSDGTITEAMFNSRAINSSGWVTQPNLDQSQFDTLSFAGARYFADEVRVATTFNEVIGLAPEPSTAVLSLLGLGACLRRRRK